MAQQIASLFATVGADLTGLTSGLSQARGHQDGFAGQMATAGANMQRVGGVLTAAVTTPLLGAGIAALKVGADFESATNILAIAARQSGTPLEDLRKAALAVGNDTQLLGIDAMEAADAMTTFYKAGFSTSEIMGDLNAYLSEGTNLSGALRASVDLAAASDLNLASASDAVAIAMKTFGLDASQATSIADSFVGAADASVAEVSHLVDAMYTFGPTANQFGWSLQDTNTALAILSDRGISGAEAGTALRSMMTNIMRGTDDTTAALEALNISLYDQNGQMRSMPDIIGQLSTALGGLSDEQRNAYIQTLAGTYGMKAMATFVEEGTAGWAEMEKKIDEAATAQEVAQKRTEGLGGALEQFQGAVQTLAAEASTAFLPTVTEMTKETTSFVNALGKLHPDTMEGLVKFGGVLAALGPSLWGLGQVVKLLALIPGSLLAIGGAAAGLGGLLWFGSEKGDKFTDSLWKLDEAVFALGGAEGLQKWIGIRQGIEGLQHDLSLPAVFEDARKVLTGQAPEEANKIMGYPGRGGTIYEEAWAKLTYPPATDPYEGLDRTAGDPRLFEWSQFQERLGLTGMPATEALFGDTDAEMGFSLTPAQTPEEVAALAEAVLPPEGSLTRSVTIAARADPAQLERSADEVAAAWERAIAQRLERLKRNKMVETGGLLEEAAAVGMAR